jgi:hypothetical protein
MQQKVILLTRSTMLQFSIGGVMRCSESELCRESEMTGSGTTTPPSTCPTLSRTSWLNFRSHTCCSLYSPDMAPCDLLLFSYMKMLLKGNKLHNMEEITWNAMKQLLAIPESQFQKCFGQWKDCWNKRVVSEGDYFEGD